MIHNHVIPEKECLTGQKYNRIMPSVFTFAYQIISNFNRKKTYLMLRLSLLLLFLYPILSLQSQDPAWDDTSRKAWPETFKDIEIVSSVDGKIQKAYFYASKSVNPRPLVVSLHTWSNNYQQADPLIKEILERDYHYIRPDFRGPNNTPEACGSPLVATDIDDAIDFAIQNAMVDPHNIHIIGTSGGGHATLITYMQSRHDIRSFSAWVPISDIAQWYYESKGRNARYASHIALATTGDENRFDPQEALKRSPLHMQTPVERRVNSKLYIYTGIHDGYTGSVPITHSLQMYNKVVSDYRPANGEALISENLIQQLLASRYNPTAPQTTIAARQIHLQRNFEDKVQILLFEGGHEMLVDAALHHIPAKTILAIGDSNGANPGGWVDQLQSLQFNNHFINTSVSGNTIGFDNLGQASKNTLKNVNKILQEHDAGKNRIDQILILLGTNDCKAEFHKRQKEVSENYRRLLQEIKKYYGGQHTPELVVISPPPYGQDHQLADKYHGAAERVKKLNAAFKKLAAQETLKYIDIQTPLWPLLDTLSEDGVHFNAEGYRLIGYLIHQAL
ncbi:MAG: prolyl oligopeptidase family serine peptidase [Cyclobacteriaceae bacterium]|nr:prolyl oligopeptidase family serine peptidase [Cyclobacteriaceae bacterium]